MKLGMFLVLLHAVSITAVLPPLIWSNPMDDAVTIARGSSQPFTIAPSDATTCSASFPCTWNLTIVGHGSTIVVTEADAIVSIIEQFNISGTYQYFANLEYNSDSTDPDAATVRTLKVVEAPVGRMDFSPARVHVGEVVNVYGYWVSGELPLVDEDGKGLVLYQWLKRNDSFTNSLTFKLGGANVSATTSFSVEDLDGGLPTNITLLVRLRKDVDGPAVPAPTQILVEPYPTAVPAFSVATSTVGAAVDLRADFPGGGTFPFTYTWTLLEDGTLAVVDGSIPPVSSSSTTRASTAYTLTQAGTFRLRLTMVDDVGIVSDPFTTTSTLVVNGAPVATVDLPADTTVGLNVTMSGGVAQGTPPYTYVWDVLSADGASVVASSDAVVTAATAASAVFVFDPPYLVGGARTSFKVRTRATDAAGVVATAVTTATMTVDPMPTATVAINSTRASVGDTVAVDVSAVVGAAGSFTITAVLVREADGAETSLGTVVDPSGASFPYTFVASDLLSGYATNFTARVVVEDVHGAASFPLVPVEDALLVRRPEVGAEFLPAESTVGAEVSLVAVNTSGFRPPYTYTWTILLDADGSAVDSILPVATTTTAYTFGAGALSPAATTTHFRVQVQATDAEGATSLPAVSAAALVVNPAPEVAFTDPAVVAETTVTALFSFTVATSGGTPTAGGTYNYTLGAVDGADTPLGDAAQAVVGATPLTASFTFTAAHLSPAGVSTDYELTAVATDGVGVASTEARSAVVRVNPAATAATAAFAATVGTVDVPIDVVAGGITGGTGAIQVTWDVLAADGATVVDASAATATATAGDAAAPYVFRNALLGSPPVPTSFTLRATVTDALGVATVLVNVTNVTVTPAFEALASFGAAVAVVGEAVPVTAVCSGGVLPYQVAWTVVRAAGGADAGVAIPAASITSGTSVGETVTFGAGDLTGAAPTAFLLAVAAEDAVGSNDTFTNTSALTVYPRASATVAMVPAATTVTAAVNFTASAVVAVPGDVTYTWTVRSADGTAVVDASLPSVTSAASSAATPYTFTAVQLEGGAPTDFTVRLDMVDSHGLPSTAAMATVVTVNPVPVPAVSFTPAATTAGEAVSVAASVTHGTPPFTYAFDLLNATGTTVLRPFGPSPSSSSPSATLTVANGELAGDAATDFRVRVTVTDAVGVARTAVSASVLTVNPGLDVAAAAAAAEWVVGEAVAVAVTVAGGTPAPAGYSFTLTMVANSTGVDVATAPTVQVPTSPATLTHTFAAADLAAAAPTAYFARVLIEDSVGISAVATSPAFVVYPRASAAVAVSPPATTVTAAVNFTASAVVAVPGDVTYTWTVRSADGTAVVDASLPSVTSAAASAATSYTFTAGQLEGGITTDFTVRLDMVDSHGLSSTTTMDVIARANPLPTVAVPLPVVATTIGVPFSAVVAVAGGTAPYAYTWEVRYSSSLAPLPTASGAAAHDGTATPATYVFTEDDLVNASATNVVVTAEVTDAAGVAVAGMSATVVVNPALVVPAFVLPAVATTVGVSTTYSFAGVEGGTGAALNFSLAAFPVDAFGNVSDTPVWVRETSGARATAEVTAAFSASDLGGADDRQFVLRVTVTDAAGATATVQASGAVTVAQAPTVTVAVAPSTVTTGANITISGTRTRGTAPLALSLVVVDDSSGVSVATVAEGVVGTGAFSVEFPFETSFGVGSFTVRASVEDAAGATTGAVHSDVFFVNAESAGFVTDVEPEEEDAVLVSFIIVVALFLLAVLICATVLYFFAWTTSEVDVEEGKDDVDWLPVQPADKMAGAELGRQSAPPREVVRAKKANARAAPTPPAVHMAPVPTSSDSDEGPINEWDANYRAMTGQASQGTLDGPRALSSNKSAGYLSQSYADYQRTLPDHMRSQQRSRRRSSYSSSSGTSYESTQDLKELFDQAKRALVDYTDEIIDNDDKLERSAHAYRLASESGNTSRHREYSRGGSRSRG